MNHKRSVGKKAVASFEIVLLILATFAFVYLISDTLPTVQAAEQKVCCEKTNSGGWCVFTEQSNCDSDYRLSPTSCESTSYCKQGCCFDSDEGICMESTSERVCENLYSGTWADSKECEIPQCELGCCILGTQAALVSSTRCKSLSIDYGLNITYKKNIQSEAECIEEALSQDQGACVFESEFQTTCKFTTRQQCKSETDSDFYKDYLCSNDELNTICAKQFSTGCYDGKVYWRDSCGNKENIYAGNSDAERDKSWNSGKVLKTAPCTPQEAKTNPQNCGNCDYLQGTTCKEYSRGDKKPEFGDYVCRDLDCYNTYNGENYKHGESWCVYDNQFDSVGSRQWRHICIEGEEILEPCADYRQEICITGSITTDEGVFREAACRANRWQQCFGLSQDDCSNTIKGDCSWIPALEDTPGVCVPTFSPGLQFWAPEASNVCGGVSTTCTVILECGIGDDPEDGDCDCIQNCECLEDSWGNRMNQICSKVGDCGGKINIVGKANHAYTWLVDDEKRTAGIKSDDDYGDIEEGDELASEISDYFTYSLLGTVGLSALYIGTATGGGWSMIGSSIGLWGPKGAAATAFPTAAPILATAAWALAIGQIVGFAAGLFGAEEGLSQALSTSVSAGILTGGILGGITTSVSGTVSAGTVLASGTVSGLAEGATLTVTNAAGTTVGTYGVGGEALTTYTLAAGEQATLTGGTAVAAEGSTAALSTGLVVGIAIAAAVIIFLLLYKETEEIEVSFTCMPWQAPQGGNECKLCNTDPMKPCSEYRCKSLGQTCSLLNAGTGNEACVNIHPHDVTSPVIYPWTEELLDGHQYSNVKTRPPSTGMTIINTESEDGCIKAYTPLRFGILTRDGAGVPEPAVCKIDYNNTVFDNMRFYFGESNLYLYNHTQTLSLPGIAEANANSPELRHDGEFTLYVKCQDGNGNTNDDAFAIRFCVDKEPDTTPPLVQKTSFIGQNNYVSNDAESSLAQFYINEPADCRWSKEDEDYTEMENQMICEHNTENFNPDLTYTCTTTLTGIQKGENDFYVRCIDQPELAGTDEENKRNTNTQSFPLTLTRTQELEITYAGPNGTIKGSAEPVNVYLNVETAQGAENGKASCYYSSSLTNNQETVFSTTGENIHSQLQGLSEGSYDYDIVCRDLGGNEDTASLDFDVKVDSSSADIVRVFNSGGKLEIITSEDSTCRYSLTDCSFDLSKGDGIDMPVANTTQHETDWQTDKTYYIKCVDKYGNSPGTDCSMIVRPYDLD